MMFKLRGVQLHPREIRDEGPDNGWERRTWECMGIAARGKAVGGGSV